VILIERDPWTHGSRKVWIVTALLAAGAAVLTSTLPIDNLLVLLLFSSLVGVAALPCTGHPRALVTLGAIVYVVLLHWVYLDWVTPSYAYYGLIETGPDPLTLLVITMLSILPALWLPTELHQPSDIVLWFLFLFGYVPAVSIPIHILGPDLWSVLPFVGTIAVAFTFLAVIRRIPPAVTNWNGLTERRFEILLTALGLGALAYLFMVFGVPTGVPDFESVYGTRADYDAIASVSPLAGYLVPWAGNVVFPLLISLGLARRRWLLVILGIGGDLVVYAHAGYKSVLFAIVLVPAIWVLVTRGRRVLGVSLIWASVGVIGLSVVATWVSGSLWPLALFVTRLLAVPGQMAAYYYDFFSTHDTYLLSASFLRLFMSQPYALDPPHLIGALYLHSATTDANANLWADAMANFGLIGIIPFTLVLGGLLWVLDSLAARRDLLVVAPTMGLMGIILGNGALFTTMLTLGVGPALVLIALMPKLSPDVEPTTMALPSLERTSAHALTADTA
jgi:O-antigen polymerase